MLDPRHNFVSNINLSKSRISEFPGFIFLCGGDIAQWETSPTSARAVLRQSLNNEKHTHLQKRLILAEDINDWFDGSIYSDLVTFEQHLAALSSSIILIVESPGAIAELGSFTATTEIRKKLFVIIAQLYYDEKSFIKLGPINFLENENKKYTAVFDWVQKSCDNPPKIEPNLDLFRKDCDLIIEEINQQSSDKGESVFNSNPQRHKLLLIRELCGLFSGLKYSEIKDYLSILGVNLGDANLKQLLFILTKTRLLKTQPFSTERFYCAPEWSPCIKFRFKESRIDLERVAVEVSQFYKAHDKTRFKAIQSFKDRYR